MIPKMHREPDNPANPWFTDGSVDYERVQGSNPAGGGEYPKMLYRAGAGELIHGVPCQTVIADTEEQEDALVAEGWATTPKRAGKLIEAEPEAPRRGRGPRTENETLALPDNIG